MKKFFTTILGCALFALPVSAQLEMPTNMRGAANHVSEEEKGSPIFEVQGKAQDYIKTYSGWYVYTQMEHVENQEVDAQIVWGDNNEVYFRDLISMMPFGTYVKGTLDGNKITVPLPQTIYIAESEYDEEIIQSVYTLSILDRLDIDSEDEYYFYFWPSEEPGEITFTIADNGEVTMDPLDEINAIGIAVDEGDGNMWMGFAEYEMTFVPKETGSVNPADLDNTPYSYFTYGYGCIGLGEPDFGYKVNVAFDGDDVYFTGLCLDDTSWWFKGRREGNQIIVDNNQKMGTISIYTVSLMFGKRDEEAYGGFSLLPADTQFIFNYDEENKVFTTATPDVVMFINALPDQIYYLTMVEDPTFIYQPTAAGTPRNPWNLIFNAKTYDRVGYGVFDVNLPLISTDGILLNRENMYYNIYIDGEIVEMEASEYGLPEDTENVPYNFSKQAIVAQKLSTNHEMIFHTQGFDKIGVKLVNVYDGVTYESDIVEIEVIDGEITGINEIDGANIVSETYYDLTGRKIVNPSNGIFIKQTLLNDGTVKVSKMTRR